MTTEDALLIALVAEWLFTLLALFWDPKKNPSHRRHK